MCYEDGCKGKEAAWWWSMEWRGGGRCVDDEEQRALIVEFRSPSLKNLCLRVAIHHCINKEIVTCFFKKRTIVSQLAVVVSGEGRPLTQMACHPPLFAHLYHWHLVNEKAAHGVSPHTPVNSDGCGEIFSSPGLQFHQIRRLCRRRL